MGVALLLGEGQERKVGALSLDVVLVGEDDDSSGVAGLHQTLDNLVKLSSRGLTRDLHRLSDADTTWTRAVRFRTPEISLAG